jgi:lysozyme
MPINAVIDISHHNGPKLDFAKAKADGILGVLHKASQGQSGGDPMYDTNRKKVAAAGLLWGAYHFGTNADGAKQARASSPGSAIPPTCSWCSISSRTHRAPR